MHQANFYLSIFAVTESGNIVYLFPDLQITISDEKESKIIPYLNEFTWQFSRVNKESMIHIQILAVINFVSSWFVFTVITKHLYFPSHLHVSMLDLLMAYVVAYSFLFPIPLLLIMVIYGTGFIVILLIRFLVIKLFNAQIKARNELKEEYANYLIYPNPDLQNKLTEAQQQALSKHKILPNNIIYDTEKELLEQKFQQEYEL